MGYFDALTSGSFKTTKDGRRLFFPWGILGRGYVIPSEEEYENLRRKIKTYLIISFPIIIILVNRINILCVFILIAVLTIPYKIWASIQCRQMAPATEKYKFKESLTAQAKEQNTVTLWLLEASSIAFVGAGIYILYADPKSWLVAGAAITFFGLCAVMFGITICTKKQLQNK